MVGINHYICKRKINYTFKQTTKMNTELYFKAKESKKSAMIIATIFAMLTLLVYAFASEFMSELRIVPIVSVAFLVRWSILNHKIVKYEKKIGYRY